MCHTALSYYLRATMCFAHFQILKIMKYSFAIFHQIHRLLYANGEIFTFFSHGLLFFRIKLCFNKKMENHLKGWVGASPAPTNVFLGAGLGFTRPWKCIYRGG